MSKPIPCLQDETSCPLTVKRVASDKPRLSQTIDTPEKESPRNKTCGYSELKEDCGDFEEFGSSKQLIDCKPLRAKYSKTDIKHCCVSPCNVESVLDRMADFKLKDCVADIGSELAPENNCGNELQHGKQGDSSLVECGSAGRQDGSLCKDKLPDVSCCALPDQNNNAPDGNSEIPVIESLQDLITALHKVFEEDIVNVEYVEFLMKSYKSNASEWMKYAKFDKFKYTRNLVDAGNNKFNLMILCWGEGHGSSVHDHADAHCFMKMLDGGLTETRYAWPKAGEESETLSALGKSQLKLNDVCYINDSLGLHRVENSSYSDRAVSLHLYSPPFSACHVFNERTGRKTVSQVTFWSKFGKRERKTQEIESVRFEDN